MGTQEWLTSVNMRVFYFLSVLTLLGLVDSRGAPCYPSKNNSFVFRVNHHTSGLLGEFEVEGCTGTSPTLIMARGVTYTFIQYDVTNWFHPLDFAYYPDGKHGYGEHAKVPKLEYPTPVSCNSPDFLCNPGEKVKQGPIYGIDGIYTSLEEDGLGGEGGYKNGFKLPQKQWKDHKFTVQLTIPLDSKTETLFYYCRIHGGMNGMIKISNPVENYNRPVTLFDPDTYYTQATEFDNVCGTSGVAPFHHDKDLYCPGMEFLCEQDDNPTFSMCMEAIDCKMKYQMTVEEHHNPLVVFMHQMIPHHENAVNMARIALKLSTAAEGYDDPKLDVAGLMRDIIATQNEQIQHMEEWLERHGAVKPTLCKQKRRQFNAKQISVSSFANVGFLG